MRHGCVLVSRDVRRDRKSVLVRPAPALAQRQAVGAAGAAAIEIQKRDVSARVGDRARLRTNELLRPAVRRFLRFRFVLRERKAGEAGTKPDGGSP
jgi:hypothetical protein